MNRRERLRRCYFNEQLDRPAAYSRTSFPENDRSYDKLKAYLLAHSELKEAWDGTKFDGPYQIEQAGEPYSEDFARQVTVLHTPKGDLQSSFLVGLKGQPGIHESYFLEDRGDAEKYLSLPLPTVSGDVSSFFDTDRKIGDSGIVDVCIGFNPAGFVAELFGSETFAIMSKADRDVVDALCERQMKIIMNRLKFFISQKVGPFFSMLGEEYIVPPLHSPQDFYDFNVKYDKPIIDLGHDGGGRFHIHSHGSIKKVFQGFIDMGADVLHPFEAPPMGDILAAEAKEMARGKLCLEGNIQISHMYETAPEQIREQVGQLIKDAFDDRKGLIVCPTASPYIYGKGENCLPQYKAMIDTVLASKE